MCCDLPLDAFVLVTGTCLRVGSRPAKSLSFSDVLFDPEPGVLNPKPEDAPFSMVGVRSNVLLSFGMQTEAGSPITKKCNVLRVGPRFFVSRELCIHSLIELRSAIRCVRIMMKLQSLCAHRLPYDHGFVLSVLTVVGNLVLRTYSCSERTGQSLCDCVVAFLVVFA